MAIGIRFEHFAVQHSESLCENSRKTSIMKSESGEPIYIDESLARGLASRFLDECAKSLETFERAYRARDLSSSTRKGWLKKRREIQRLVGNISFTSHWFGSKSKPALGFLGIVPETHKYQNWNEKCLTGLAVLDQYDGAFSVELRPIPFVISHHALARLFQRCDVLKDSATHWSYGSVLDLLRPLPLWSAFWSSCVDGVRGDNIEKIQGKTIPFRFKPIIPSEYGLFFCESSAEDGRIALRTFVNNNQLREEQVVLRNFLLQVVKGFTELPIAFHPWTYVEGLYRTDLLLMLMRERLLRKKFFIKEFLCTGVSRDEIDGLFELGMFEQVFPEKLDPFSFDPVDFLPVFEELVRERKRAGNVERDGPR